MTAQPKPTAAEAGHHWYQSAGAWFCRDCEDESVNWCDHPPEATPAAVEQAARAWHAAAVDEGCGAPWDEITNKQRGQALRYMAAALAAVNVRSEATNDA